MEEIKSALEIAMEKAAEIGGLTAEEKEKMKDQEKLTSLLAEFNKGEIDATELWKVLKEEGKPYLLGEAQLKLIDSLKLKDSQSEFQRKREGILAVETLKDEQNTPEVELNLDFLQSIQKRYDEEMKKAYNDFKLRVEKDPELRTRKIQQGDTVVIIQLPLEEAVEHLPEWKDFLLEHNRKYEQEFEKTIKKLRNVIKN
ncbi:MAG: hypothetical protein C4291_15700 [Candidatus Dadabacteria bacterium]